MSDKNTLKTPVNTALNIIVLVVALLWFISKPHHEPLIVFIIALAYFEWVAINNQKRTLVMIVSIILVSSVGLIIIQANNGTTIAGSETDIIPIRNANTPTAATVHAVTAEPTPIAPTMESTPVTSETGDRIHIVQAGETLSIIGSIYGFTLDELARYNDLKYTELELEVGQKIIIPPEYFSPEYTSIPSTIDPQTGERVHVVQAGENLFRIGLIYGFSQRELESYNSLSNGDQLEVGQKIRIPPDTWSGD